MADDELLWLAGVARGCQRIVEVGFYQARSTRALADHCPGVVFCVDTCNGGYVKGSQNQFGHEVETAWRRAESCCLKPPGTAR